MYPKLQEILEKQLKIHFNKYSMNNNELLNTNVDVLNCSKNIHSSKYDIIYSLIFKKFQGCIANLSE